MRVDTPGPSVAILNREMEKICGICLPPVIHGQSAWRIFFAWNEEKDILLGCYVDPDHYS